METSGSSQRCLLYDWIQYILWCISESFNLRWNIQWRIGTAQRYPGDSGINLMEAKIPNSDSWSWHSRSIARPCSVDMICRTDISIFPTAFLHPCCPHPWSTHMIFNKQSDKWARRTRLKGSTRSSSSVSSGQGCHCSGRIAFQEQQITSMEWPGWFIPNRLPWSLCSCSVLRFLFLQRRNGRQSTARCEWKLVCRSPAEDLSRRYYQDSTRSR